jgi:hypothetical protein
VTYTQGSEYRVIFKATPSDLGQDMPGLGTFTGLAPDELDELSEATNARLSLLRGSVGYGESSTGIELVITLASIPANVLGLVAAGKAVKSVIEKIQSRRKRTVTITDSKTMAAVAVTSVKPELLDKLAGIQLRSVRNLFGGEPPWFGTIWGTDARHVWAVTFEQTVDGYAFIIFMSPTGLVLGHTQVPLEEYFDGTTYHRRTPEDLTKYQMPE